MAVIEGQRFVSAAGFSLFSGSLVRKLLQRARILQPAHRAATICAFSALTWLPLMMLAGIDGTAWGKKVMIPLVRDYSVYARFLVALPLLLATEPIIDQLIRNTISTLDSSGIIGNDELPTFHAMLAGIARLRESIVPDLIFAALSLFPYFLFLADYQWQSGEVSTWHGSIQARLTPAGWWFTLVAAPLLRLLMFQWLWRGALWGFLLWKVSNLNLRLLPTHPDRLGGLGFLLHAQEQFGVFAMALGSVVAGQFANEIFHFGARYKELLAPMGVFVALSLVFVLLPLTFFSRQLFRARYHGLVRYSVAGRKVTQQFETKWIQGEGTPAELMIGTQDPSSLIDYISSYEVILKTRLVPISRRSVVHIAALAAAPFAFVWLMATPFDKVVEEIVKRMF